MNPVLTKVALIGVGAATTALGGSTLAASAASLPNAGTHASAALHSAHAGRHHPRWGMAALRGTVLGKVVSDTTTGGAHGGGQLIISQPDGGTLTYSFTRVPHIFLYHGQGERVTRVSQQTLASGMVVIVKGFRNKAGVYTAGVILESGYTAS